MLCRLRECRRTTAEQRRRTIARLACNQIGEEPENNTWKHGETESDRGQESSSLFIFLCLTLFLCTLNLFPDSVSS
jgi:hypothetical protein